MRYWNMERVGMLYLHLLFRDCGVVFVADAVVNSIVRVEGKKGAVVAVAGAWRALSPQEHGAVRLHTAG